jgi:hypothetical protein
MDITTEQVYEWGDYLRDAPSDATPPVFALLAHWREVAAMGQTIAWGPDRAEAILSHIEGLEAQADALRETITFNRKQAEREHKRHLRELSKLRAQYEQAAS